MIRLTTVNSLLILVSAVGFSSLVVAVVSGLETDEFFPDERNALIQIRDIVNATVNLHKNWTGPPCLEDVSRWFGITCSKGHITRIVLEGIHLTASFPPAFLQNITFLNTLSFKNNSVYGPLPNLTTLIHLQFVFFSQNNFSGSIPFHYIGLPNLTVLELQQNSLDGHVPPFAQPTLTIFNVSYNHLEGPIPDTPVLQRFPESSYDHNTDLCGLPLGKVCPNPSTPPAPVPAPPPPNPSKRLKISSLALILAGATLLPVLVMVVLIILCCYKRKSQRKGATATATTTTGQQTGEASVEWSGKRRHSRENREDHPERTTVAALEFFDKDKDMPPPASFDLDDLLRASAEVLEGKGKLGPTYKATLESGSVVVVKRLKDLKGLSKKEFVKQMQWLGKTRHENLVEIISFYYSKEEKLIVYEFVPDALSLFELLHGNRGAARVPLSWSRRLSIIKDIAKGLAFLHQSLPSHMVMVPHANLKSSNVLIIKDSSGQNYHSKLVDFGYFPLLPLPSEKLAIAKSPEFALGKKLTLKADVYCFGIIVLEVITGRIPGEASSPGMINETVDDLSDWVRMVVNNNWSTDILDLEIVAAGEGHNEMLKLTGIALECTDSTPEKRPKMSELLTRIQEIEDIHGGKESQVDS